MATYSRTIARITSGPMAEAAASPQWRRAMTQLDRLYNVSADIPNSANGLLAPPYGFPLPYGWGNPTSDGAGWDVMSGYSSGVLLEDVGGPFGTIVFGTGGHTRIQNNLLSLDLSQDVPTFGWWQQPYYQRDASDGAELYYNRAEFDALPASRRTGDGLGTEVRMTAAWIAAGAQFPMGYNGWIFPRKLVFGQLGKNNPHGFRYMAPNYLPPALTGTGSGAYIVVEAPQGPFAQGWLPEGAARSDMVDPSALWPSGRRKWPVWYKNVQTGAWARIVSGFQPDYAGYGFIRQHTAVARRQKRLYVSVDEGNGTAAYWYVDFSAGVLGATISALIRPSTAVAPNRATTGAFTDGHPDGRHLWFWPDLSSPTGLIVQDLDAGTQSQLEIGQGLRIAATESPAMQYDAANNRILLLQRSADDTLSYRAISIPRDPLDSTGYAVSQAKPLAVDGSVRQPIAPTHFYSKAFLHPGLGVMFVPQDRGNMLAFRPSI